MCLWCDQCVVVCLLLQDAFSLLAYSDPWNSPVGYQLDAIQREPVCSTLNSAILGRSSVRPADTSLSSSLLFVCLLSPVLMVFFLLFLLFLSRDSQPAQAAPPGPGRGSGRPVPRHHGTNWQRLLRLCLCGRLPALALYTHTHTHTLTMCAEVAPPPSSISVVILAEETLLRTITSSRKLNHLTRFLLCFYRPAPTPPRIRSRFWADR